MIRHLNRYRSKVRAGFAMKEPAVSRRLIRISLVMAGLVFLYILVAIFLVPPGETRHYNFVDERGAITALSAVFLSMGCGFGFVTHLFVTEDVREVRFFWLLVSAALGFLVLDELLQFHERIGGRLDGLDPFGLAESGTIRGWNDAIVILYGVVALPVAVILLPAMIRYKTFLTLICLAFVAYVTHTAIDSLVEPPTVVSVILEESAKLYCSLSLALACLAGLLVHADRGVSVGT